MADTTLLTELCSICNSNPFKYRCPGCSARTCSLPCYKRHQQWAQCSGKRDPTKYVKKSELSTPAGLDHDYNFIASIERGLAREDEEVKSLGLDLSPDAPRRRGEIKAMEDKQNALNRLFSSRGVNVIRAPRGMSRQKENKTHRTKRRVLPLPTYVMMLNKLRGHILWTVEWFLEDGSRTVAEISETATITQADKLIAKKDAKDGSKKRKRTTDDEQASGKVSEVVSESAIAEPIPDTTANAEKQEPTQLPLQETAPALIVSSEEDTASVAGPSSAVNKTCSSEEVQGLDPPENQPPSPSHYFYLLKPRTSSEKKVFIPLSATATLSECLRGRTVLEYPTIYVMPQAPDSLPSDFLLDEQYMKQMEEEQKELDELLEKVGPESLNNPNSAAKIPSHETAVDDKALLEVLQKDIAAAGQ